MSWTEESRDTGKPNQPFTEQQRPEVPAHTRLPNAAPHLPGLSTGAVGVVGVVVVVVLAVEVEVLEVVVPAPVQYCGFFCVNNQSTRICEGQQTPYAA